MSNKHKKKHFLTYFSVFSLIFSLGFLGIFYIVRFSYTSANNDNIKSKKNIELSNIIKVNSILKNIDTKKFDLETDASYQKYLSIKHPLNDKKYTPVDLVKYDTKYLITKAQHNVLRRQASIYLWKMAKDFYNEFWIKLCIRSAYRTYNDQKKLLRNCENWLCANIYSSEHSLWTAIDLNLPFSDWTCKAFYPSTKYYKRLETNAYKYWFVNTYKKWYSDDWIKAEPRHRNFVSINYANFLHKNNLTPHDYFHILKSSK